MLAASSPQSFGWCLVPGGHKPQRGAVAAACGWQLEPHRSLTLGAKGLARFGLSWGPGWVPPASGRLPSHPVDAPRFWRCRSGAPCLLQGWRGLNQAFEDE